MGALMLRLQQRGQIDIHEPRTEGKSRPGGDLHSTLRKTERRGLNAHPDAGCFSLKVFDEVFQWTLA